MHSLLLAYWCTGPASSVSQYQELQGAISEQMPFCSTSQCSSAIVISWQFPGASFRRNLSRKWVRSSRDRELQKCRGAAEVRAFAVTVKWCSASPRELGYSSQLCPEEEHLLPKMWAEVAEVALRRWKPMKAMSLVLLVARLGGTVSAVNTYPEPFSW